MDSEDDGFPKQGGEALELGDDFDSDDQDADDGDGDGEPQESKDAMR